MFKGTQGLLGRWGTSQGTALQPGRVWRRQVAGPKVRTGGQRRDLWAELQAAKHVSGFVWSTTAFVEPPVKSM